MIVLPSYGLRAYALFYSRHGAKGEFGQSELDWIVSQSMKKKIFALLARTGWILKIARGKYRCVSPEVAIKGLLEFRVPELLKKTNLPYALTGASSVELWSDYSYVQRGLERSPYFIKVLKKDLRKWRSYLNSESIPNYTGTGSSVGEFVILQPVEKLEFVERDGLKVEPVQITVRQAARNDLYAYPLNYIKKKYGV